MTIVKAKPNNIKEIVQLWLDFMNEHDQIVLKADPQLLGFIAKQKDMAKKYEIYLKTYIKTKNSVIFVATENNTIVGYIRVLIKEEIPIFQCKQMGYISDLYIKEGFRSQGLSTKLKNQALAWLKTKKMTCVAMPMYPANKNAHAIYEKWGFFDYKVEMRMKI